MGTCQSLLHADASAQEHAATKPSSASRKPRGSGKSRRLKVIIQGQSSKQSSIFSPSERTEATQPTTPASLWASPNSSSLKGEMLESLAEGKDEDAEIAPSSSLTSFADLSPLTFHGDLNRTVIDNVITEEESLEAPSDEEDAHELHLKKKMQERTALPSKKEGDLSHTIAGLQSRIKILNSRITAPESIIHRNSLLAPPKGAVVDTFGPTVKTSVNPQTIANFNKLKIQVQLANRAEKHRRHKAKLEDRFEDVQGYRDLWSEYEEIQQQVDAQYSDTEKPTARSHKRNDSLDLNEPTTWYFDFQSMHGKIQDDDDDNRSQASFSLLSGASMEAQRRIYKESARKRRKNKGKVRGRRDVSDDRSICSLNSVASRASRISSVVFVRGQTEDNDYGPIRHVTSSGASITNIEVAYDLGSDDNSPRAKPRIEDDDNSRIYPDDTSIISDLDMDNDYNVPRRRRRKHANDDSSLATFDDNKSFDDTYKLSNIEFDMTDFKPRIGTFTVEEQPSMDIGMKLPGSPQRIEQYGFDPAAPLSSQMDIFSDPLVQIDDADTGVVRWREFMDTDEKVKTARRLEDLYGADEEGEKGNSNEKVPTGMELSEEEAGTGLNDTSLGKVGTSTDVPRTVEPQRYSSSKAASDGAVLAEHSSGSQLPRATKLGTSAVKSSEVPKPALPEAGDGKYPNNLYRHNPFEEMSTEHFLMMSSVGVSTIQDEDSDEAKAVEDDNSKVSGSSETEMSNREESAKTDDTEPEPAFQGGYEDQITQSDEGSRKRSRLINTYNPLIEKMSSEAFLRLSSWHSVSLPSDPDPIVEVSDVESTLPKLDNANELDPSSNALAALEEPLEVPSDESASKHFESTTVFTTEDESREDREFRTPSTSTTLVEERQLSAIRCDALAEKVSTELDLLLSKFREEGVEA